MNKNTNQVCLAALALTIALGLSGCHGNQPQSTQDNGQNAAPPDQTQGQDPAQANQIDASSETAPAPTPAESQPEGSNYPSDNNYYPEYSGTEAEQEAPQPPPPLPEYEQPECPGPDYIWTPGYWAWGSAGYYWVPGVWVAAPYTGALWTPGYWGFSGAAYVWHHGYWGPHIGFYGGINYGFGYTGVGFEGGYWSNRGFQYNRAVTNVNTTNVTNVYDRTAVNNEIVNNTRVSYNGGSGGVHYQPRAPELAASRERHVAALPAQVQMVRAAATNRAQFASVNHGRPQVVVQAKPVVVRPINPPATAVNPAAHMAAGTAPATGAPMEPRPATPGNGPAAPARTAAPARPRVEAPGNPPNRAEPQRAVPVVRPATPGYRPPASAPPTATPTRPRVEAPANPPNRAEPQRGVLATRPAQPTPVKPATRAPARPPAPRETQTREAPPRQPGPEEKKQGRRPDENKPPQ